MTRVKLLTTTTRYVSDFGETLVVRDHFGIKVLTDPVDDTVAIIVPTGRKAKLISLTFDVPVSNSGRDADVITIEGSRGLGFASARHPKLCVYLQDLPEYQRVDVMPAAEPAVAYVTIPKPMPKLSGAITLQQPIYAAAAAA